MWSLIVLVMGLWLLSPLALIPIVIILAVRNGDLKRENTRLRKGYRPDAPAGSAPEGAADPAPAPVRTPPAGRRGTPPAGAQRAEAPQRAPVPPVPREGQAAPVPPKSRAPVASVNVALAIGALFVLLAGLIFATTTWRYLPGPARAAVLCMVTPAFFGASFFTERKLKLRQTGLALFALGCLFIPVILLAVGHFALLGAWFSTAGAGKYVLGFTAALLTALACVAGARRYAAPVFAWAGLMCGSLAVFFLCLATYLPTGPVSLLLALLCAGELALAGRVKFPASPFSILTDRLRPHAVWNLLLFGGWTLLQAGGGGLSALAGLLFALLFLCKCLDGEEKLPRELFVVLFTLFWLAGSVRLNGDGGPGRLALLLAAASAVAALLGALKLTAGEGLGRLLRLSAGVCSAAALAAGGLGLLRLGAWSPSLLLACAILTLLVSYVWLWYGERAFLYAQPVFLLALCAGLASYFVPTREGGGLALAALAFCAFWLSRLPVRGRRLNSPVSDLLFCLCPLGQGVWLSLHGAAPGGGWFALGALLLFCAQVAALALGPRPGLRRTLARWLLPHAPLLLLYTLTALSGAAWEWLLEGYLVLVCAAALWGRRGRWDRPFRPALAAALCLHGAAFPLVILWLEGAGRPLGFWLLALYWGAALLRREEAERPSAAAALSLCGACVLAASGLSALALWRHAAPFWLVCVPAGLAALGWPAWLALSRKRPGGTLLRPLWRFLAVAVNLCGTAAALLYLLSPLVPAWAAALCALFLGVGFACLRGGPHTAPAQVIPLAWAYPLLLGAMDRLGYPPDSPAACGAAAALFLALALLGRLTSPGFFRRAEGVCCDWCALLNLSAPVLLLLRADPYWRFGGWLLLALWLLQFLRRVEGPRADRLLLTGTGCVLCAAWWFQPFWTPPPVLVTEWLLLAPALLLGAARRWIWPENRRMTGLVQLAYGCVCAVLLGLEAAWWERPADALILGGLALAVLALALFLHRKGWFALSAATLLCLGVYMTRGFWLSLAWWIYLLSAGLVLIGLASVNERLRQRGKSLGGRLAGLVQDWEW
ncbi:hypothetical protein CE91St41_02540 [Oscillospiraceae bacterium]|nr:hypothetical protein CE91St40_02540 [Oscillospiraceae bacterium]BDF73365.1 hypothetical protein CE91St41_02540 [Oscillospiraceae bacterium]